MIILILILIIVFILIYICQAIHIIYIVIINNYLENP